MHALQERTILITGATDGLGRALAQDFANRGATVLLHGRRRPRLERTREDIREATGSRHVHPYLADFASLDEVGRLAEEVARDHARIDLLINNAGVGPGRRGAARETSADGHELHFAVNSLAPFLLTRLLLPLLRRSAAARVVNVASAAQEAIDFGDLGFERDYDGMRAYRRSKLALIMLTFELAERLRDEGTGITANALHPATLMDTKMVREFGQPQAPLEDGLEATMWVATSPDLQRVSGRYFDRLREARAHEQAYDREALRRLWQAAEECVAPVLRAQ